MNEEKRRADCKKKTAFKSRERAEQNAFWANCTVYKCVACHKYHLTSQNVKERKSTNLAEQDYK